MFFEAHMVRTSMELFAAFALPHLLLAHIIYAKLQGAPRLSVFAGMREVMLSFYMLLRTSISFIFTELGNSKNLFQPKKDTERTLPLTFENTTGFSYCVTLFIHVVGLTLGLIRWFFSNAQPDVFAPLYFSWSAYNLMLLLAMLAVAKESRLIHWKSRQYLQMPAMIKFSNGRSTSCMTENFPAQILELRLPSDVIVEPQSAVIVSIFRGHQEFALASQVVSQQERMLRVVMQDLACDDYRTLGSAVYSRDKNWPKWLPGRNADQLPPLWVVRILRKIQKTALLLLSRLDIFPKLQQFSLWIQRWKKKL
jgi:cellulose synthase (UDP-forming)